MILPAARQDQQSFLPEADKEMTSLSQRRVYVGEFFERATQTLFNAERLTVSTAADICPDLVMKPSWFVKPSKERYLENKSIGKSGELVVRKVQYEREQEFAEKNECYYVLWRHDAPVIQAPTRLDLYAMLAKHAKEVLVIPTSVIHDLCKQRPLIRWTQLGQTDDKCCGYRIRWKDLSAVARGQQENVVWSVKAGEHEIGPITLRVVSCSGRTDDTFVRAVYRGR